MFVFIPYPHTYILNLKPSFIKGTHSHQFVFFFWIFFLEMFLFSLFLDACKSVIFFSNKKFIRDSAGWVDGSGYKNDN